MARKLLTAIDQVVSRTAIIRETTTAQAETLARARTFAEQTRVVIMQKTTYKFLDVQRLLLQTRLMRLRKLVPILESKPTARRISTIMMPLLEEEEMYARRKMTLRQYQELREERPQRLRPEQVKQEMRLLRLHRETINLTDQLEFALMEKYLWLNLRTETLQVLQKILKMCTAKQWYCETIVGLEALTELLLQMYVYAFMEYPRTAVMFAMKVSPITMMLLSGKVASIYGVCSMQAQHIKTKSLMVACQKRKLRTKGVASGKPKLIMVAIKQFIGAILKLAKESLVGVGKDATGNEMFFIALRYAYSLPFFMRRWFARQFGMPENHKYARYFGIGCIPTRYAKKSWKRARYPEAQYLTYSRDQYVMNAIRKYQSRHGAGRSRSGFYNPVRRWRKEGYEV